nr:hypothetical protein [Tanacetum cinerariifolium]
MLLYKQEEAGIQLNVEQANWRDDTDDDELEDQELEAHYMYMAQIQLVKIILFIVDSGCSKHMTGNLKLLINFVEKFPGTVKFRNDQIAPILSYRDLVQGAIMIEMVYYVEGLNHNLFFVGQLCSRGMDLYSIALQDTTSPNPICLIAKATSSQAWLWHRRLSHLNFDTINLLSMNDIVVGLPKLKFAKEHLCSSCELGKATRNPMRVASINGKRYVLVIVHDYSRYTWTYFLRSKDETPEVLIDFLRLVQRGLHAQVRIVRTDKGTEILNKTLHVYFVAEGINHQTSVARTPEQNGVVKRQNRTIVEAAQTMLSAAKVPMFFWAEAISIACFTQNRSLVIPRHEKTPYHIINDRKPSVKFFYIFGSLCYIVRDGENLDKMNEKGDACIFVGYSTQSRSYRVFNKRTRVIEETIHVNFDEFPQIASDHVVSKSFTVTTADAPNQGQQQHTTPLNNQTTPEPTYGENLDKMKEKGDECIFMGYYNQSRAYIVFNKRTRTMELNHDSLSLTIQRQANVPQEDRTVTTSNELDLLFSLMFDELLNRSSKVVSKSFAVHAADAPYLRTY